MKPTITYFLGAGASAAFGYPLTRDIFPGIWKLIWRGKSLDRRNKKLLKEFFSVVYPGLKPETKVRELPGITEVLSLVDHFIKHDAIPVPGFKPRDLASIRLALEIAMVNVIDQFNRYDADDPDDQRWDDFIDLLIRVGKGKDVSIISTNYDMLIEYGLFIAERAFDEGKEEFFRGVDFGVRLRDFEDGSQYYPSDKADFRIYKLHGSVNWLSCELCGQLYINPYGPIHWQIARKRITNANTCHCGHARLSSVIVSPSMERDVKDSRLKYIWNAAQETLRTSDEWVIIGYSMPAEDLAIRSIFSRALAGHVSRPKITVVQNELANRKKYQNMFGKMRYMKGGMESYLKST